MRNRNKKNSRISLQEISELAGVTKSSASRILNRNPNYKYADETVRKVFDVAQKHGYKTSQIYRSVFTGQTKSAGVISSSEAFYAEITRGIHDRLLQDGYATIMGINTNNFDDPLNSTEKQVIHRLIEHRVDGFILRPTLDSATDDHFREIIDMQVPLITLDRQVQSDYADFVGSDDLKGGVLAAEYLAELGHTNIVQFAANQQVSSYRNRAIGFETEAMKRGCTIQTASFHTEDDLTQKCHLLFSRNNHPTAIFCPNDTCASMLYDALRSLNIKIPDDVSIIGFGNERLSKHLYPKLTTIDQNPYQMGTQAAELLLERLQEPPKTKHQKKAIYTDVKLVVRDSCRKTNT